MQCTPRVSNWLAVFSVRLKSLWVELLGRLRQPQLCNQRENSKVLTTYSNELVLINFQKSCQKENQKAHNSMLTGDPNNSN
jgi:hypothetical protein